MACASNNSTLSSVCGDWPMEAALSLALIGRWSVVVSPKANCNMPFAVKEPALKRTAASPSPGTKC